VLKLLVNLNLFTGERGESQLGSKALLLFRLQIALLILVVLLFAFAFAFREFAFLAKGAVIATFAFEHRTGVMGYALPSALSLFLEWA